MPTSRPASLPMKRGQAAQVLLDERLDRREIEAADENEREIARVREAVLVERQRLVQVHLRDLIRRHRPRAQVILRDGRVQRVFECGVGQRLAVRQRGGQLARRRAKRFRIGARLRERQVDQLKHRFEIAPQRPAAQPLVHLIDVGTTAAVLPASFLPTSMA